MDIYKKYLFREFQWENQGFLSVLFFIAGLEKFLIMPLDIYSIYPQHNEIYFAKKGNTVKSPLQAKTLIEAEF